MRIYFMYMWGGKYEDSFDYFDSLTLQDKTNRILYYTDFFITNDIDSIRIFNGLHTIKFKTLKTANIINQMFRSLAEKYDGIGKAKESRQGELTIRDMLYRPFGVVDIPAGKVVWNIPSKYFVDIVSKRPNWKVKDEVYGITIFGNIINGVLKDNGYDLKYKGEPVFTAGIDDAYDGNIDEYSISFARAIKGVVPEMEEDDRENYLKRPQWTDEEAINFAKEIVAEVEATGLLMKPVKFLDNEIFTMGAEDNNSFYRVTVSKNSNDIYASLDVRLSVYPRNHVLNTLHDR